MTEINKKMKCHRPFLCFIVWCDGGIYGDFSWLHRVVRVGYYEDGDDHDNGVINRNVSNDHCDDEDDITDINDMMMIIK